MKSIIIPISMILVISGCSGDKHSDRPIMKFYRQAKQRQVDPNQPITLDGLKWNFGVPQNSSGAGTFEQSSLIVSDPNSDESHAVQVIVEPRVSGSFLDTANPSTDYLRQQAMDIESALKNYRYVEVLLHPK